MLRTKITTIILLKIWYIEDPFIMTLLKRHALNNGLYWFFFLANTKLPSIVKKATKKLISVEYMYIFLPWLMKLMRIKIAIDKLKTRKKVKKNFRFRKCCKQTWIRRGVKPHCRDAAKSKITRRNIHLICSSSHRSTYIFILMENSLSLTIKKKVKETFLTSSCRFWNFNCTNIQSNKKNFV